MPAEIPTNEPAVLRAGDTWKWTRSLADWPASAWTLKYRAKNAAGGFEITATASGDDFSVAVAAATTAAYAAGDYSWIAWVEAGAEKFTVDSGTWTVQAEYRTGLATVALDDRSHARKVLDAIEAFIEGNDLQAAAVVIGERQIRNIPIPELLKLRQRYLQEVAVEDQKAAIARGEGIGRRIQFRM